ncbi:MAG: major capsid protein [Alteromonadaceae bacterium]|nr:major capsid protein [Alteromonadaceae bacterium]MBL4909067.1 major capsid protein [Alteromonadaceae bacterium]MBL4909133.1 major capsid protein [Alteromonadaceae bacterium]
MNPTKGDVHVNRPLTNISVAYLQDQKNFIADSIFPNIPVSKQSDLYFMYDRGFFNRDEMKERAPGTESAGGDYTIEVDTPYYARVYSFHHDIPDQRRANTDSELAPDREATELVTRKGLIRRETLWVSKFFKAGVWTNDRTGVDSAPVAGTSTLRWNDDASTPIEDIRASKTIVLESTGFEPNTLVLGQKVVDALSDHPDIVDRVKYGQTANGPAMIELSELVALFKIPRIFVMKSIVNTAKEGAANVHSFIGGAHALLVYSAPTPGLMTPSGGYTFSWTGFLGAQPQGQRIKRFRMENLASDRVEIDMAFDQKLISADLGFFFDGIVKEV